MLFFSRFEVHYDLIILFHRTSWSTFSSGLTPMTRPAVIRYFIFSLTLIFFLKFLLQSWLSSHFSITPTKKVFLDLIFFLWTSFLLNKVMTHFFCACARKKIYFFNFSYLSPWTLAFLVNKLVFVILTIVIRRTNQPRKLSNLYFNIHGEASWQQ